MGGLVLKAQAEPKRGGGESGGADLGGEAVHKTAQQKKQRLQGLDWVLEFVAGEVTRGRRGGIERALVAAGGAGPKECAAFAEALGEGGLRQAGEVAEGAQTQAFEEGGLVVREGEQVDGQRLEEAERVINPALGRSLVGGEAGDARSRGDADPER